MTAVGERVADQADMALDVELRAVIGNDAGRFLAAVLQRVQAERDDGGGVLAPENAEHTAFVVKMIVGLGQQGIVCHWAVSLQQKRHIVQRRPAAPPYLIGCPILFGRRRGVRRLIFQRDIGRSARQEPRCDGASASGSGGAEPGDRRLRIEFSGSSGSILSSVAPIDSSSGRDLASAIQAGGLAPTSQLKNSSATATTRMPRAAP